jgi:hypothetical protein
MKRDEKKTQQVKLVHGLPVKVRRGNIEPKPVENHAPDVVHVENLGQVDHD